MNAATFLNALGQIDDKYVIQSAAYGRKRKSVWLKWGVMAACMGVLFTVAMLTLPGILREPGGILPPPDADVPGPLPGGEEGQTDEDTAQVPDKDKEQVPDEQGIVIHWEGVAVNEVEQLAEDAARRYYDPALYDQVVWGEEEILNYYGWNLVPDYIPEGLKEKGKEFSGTVIIDKESGELVIDQLGRGFWSSYYEDDCLKSDYGIVIPKGFTLEASRLGYFNCGILSSGETKVTDFNGVPVTIIHRAMAHGPYDPDSYAPDGIHHTPAGYCDLYRATFVLDGVQYDITAWQLQLEEVIKIAASVIAGPDGESVIVGGSGENLND